tara:strand:- start:603 stop:854 length:252 start_codon:yes stop_codon:yes gene_type:complete
MQNKMETETGYLLQSKIKEFNDKYNTDFEIVVTDDRGKQQDWLYCLKVGGSYLFNEGEYDGQEMYAYLCGMFHGAMIGKNHGR